MHAITATFPCNLHHLDGQRIAGTSVAIALHAAVAMVLLMPVQQPAAPAIDEPVLTWIVPTVIPVQPLPPLPPIKNEIRKHPITHTPPTAIVPITAPPTDAVDPTKEGVLPPTQIVEQIIPDNTGPSFVELNTDVAPPPTYPAMALRRNQQGRVLLRVLVDEQGRPIAVSIEQSSGVRQLDDCALKIVQTRWHFIPAQRNGAAVSAYALVPIVFQLAH